MPGGSPVVTKLIAALDGEISRLQQVRQLLAGGQSKAAKQTGKAKHTLSRAARAKISAAQKKRWAAIRKAAK